VHGEASVWNKQSSLKFSIIDRSGSGSKIYVLGIVEVPHNVGSKVTVEVKMAISVWVEKVGKVLDSSGSLSIGRNIDEDCLAIQACIELHVNTPRQGRELVVA
jgi:hypothetical protein